MRELSIHDLKVVCGGKGNAGNSARDTVISNTANNLGEGKMTWGDITGTLATIAVGTFTTARTGNAPTGIAAGGYTGGWVKNVTNDAVNALPYDGRPIFEIEHGLTEIPKSKDKSGNNYGG